MGMKPFDPFDPQLKSDPYGLFKQYRQNNPIQLGCSTTPGYADTWYFFGFEEARQLLRCDLHEPQKRIEGLVPETPPDARAKIWQHLSGWPLFQDPPLHTSRRAMLASSFRDPALAILNHATEQHADVLLGNILAKNTDELDIQTEFAFPLAVAAIFRAVGIPAPDTAWFKNITRKLVNVLDLGYVSDAYEPGLAALNELIDFVQEMTRWKTSHLDNDLLSALIKTDAEGQKLADDVITQLITQILFAGQETVADAIGNGVHALVTNPDQLAKLRVNPALMSNLITEVLRYNNPVMFMGSRILPNDKKIGHIVIPAGQPTIVAVAACNHDPRRFDKPQQLDINRDLTNTELSFGHGIHYCLGAHYARQVMQIAFTALLDKLPQKWEIAAPAVWRPNTILRGPLSLRILR